MTAKIMDNKPQRDNGVMALLHSILSASWYNSEHLTSYLFYFSNFFRSILKQKVFKYITGTTGPLADSHRLK